MRDALVIIPAYNEEAFIGKLLDMLEQKGTTAFADILVINDASRDKTGAIVRQHEGIGMLSNVFNLGYGSALQLGYKYAVRSGYSFVIQIDADGQHDIVNVKHLYESLQTPDEDGRLPDIVVGSRFDSKSISFPLTWIKKLSIRFFRRLIRMTTGQSILDPTSGLQGLSSAVFSYYSSYMNFDFDYPDANTIIQMLLRGYKVKEIPSVMYERTTGKSMHSGIIKPLIYMLTMPLSIMAVFLRNREERAKRATT